MRYKSDDLKDNDICLSVIDDQDKKVKKQGMEIENLNDQIHKMRKLIRRGKFKKSFNKFFTTTFSSLCTFIILLVIVYPVYLYFVSSASPTHCYIEHTNGYNRDRYILKGNIAWNTDLRYGRFETFEEAVEASRLIGCKFTDE